MRHQDVQDRKGIDQPENSRREAFLADIAGREAAAQAFVPGASSYFWCLACEVTGANGAWSAVGPDHWTGQDDVNRPIMKLTQAIRGS